MRRFIASLASALTANQFAQTYLMKGTRVAEYLMDVGVGSAVETSGEVSVLQRLKRSGSELVVFGVGSNKGQYLRVASEVLGSVPRQIHCFEPSKQAWTCLCESAQGMHGVTLCNVGLGREAGERILYTDKVGSTLASLTKRRLDHFGVRFSAQETVCIETLDNYCRDHMIAHIDLLKLDVEGRELDVLAGASEMFRNNAIRFVAFEFGGCNIDTRTFLQDYYYFFADRGMRIARITPSGYWVEIGDYSEIYEQFRKATFVAYSAPLRHNPPADS